MPAVRGDIDTGVGMDRHTWFGVGGAAEIMFSPADADDLAQFLAALPQDIPVYPVGAGSNLLVRDGGVSGVVINTTKYFNTATCDGSVMTVGAGA